MKARATIFAGTNGAGKTTLYYNEVELSKDFGFRINIDEIVSSFGNPKNPQHQIRASKIAIRMRENVIKNLRDFNQESTLCGGSILNLFSRLKQEKYEIILYYIGLESADLAKERVKIRVANGGHNVDEKLIEKRYKKSLQNLEKVVPLCDKIIIYDNSLNYEKLAEFTKKELIVHKKTAWIENFLNLAKKIEVLEFKKSLLDFSVKKNVLFESAKEEKMQTLRKIYEKLSIQQAFKDNPLDEKEKIILKEVVFNSLQRKN